MRTSKHVPLQTEVRCLPALLTQVPDTSNVMTGPFGLLTSKWFELHSAVLWLLSFSPMRKTLQPASCEW